MATINSLRIEKLGGRDWVVRNDCGEYLGVISEFANRGAAPFYCASIERFFNEDGCFGIPRHASLADALAVFAA